MVLLSRTACPSSPKTIETTVAGCSTAGSGLAAEKRFPSMQIVISPDTYICSSRDLALASRPVRVHWKSSTTTTPEKPSLAACIVPGVMLHAGHAQNQTRTLAPHPVVLHRDASHKFTRMPANSSKLRAQKKHTHTHKTREKNTRKYPRRETDRQTDME